MLKTKCTRRAVLFQLRLSGEPPQQLKAFTRELFIVNGETLMIGLFAVIRENMGRIEALQYWYKL